MIFISKNGALVKIVNENGAEFSYERSALPTNEPLFTYNSNNTVDIHIGAVDRNNHPLAQMTIEGVVPANKTQFYNQIALVFPDPGASGGGGGAVTQSGAWSVTANAGTNLDTSSLLTTSDFDSKIGSLTETAPATDTASSGINGRLQRIAQRITAFIGLLPSALTGSGNLKVANQEALPAGSARIGKLTVRNAADSADIDPLSESDFDTKTGALTETAPATDTASSGINGRLQRIAQRITSLIAQIPTSLGIKTAANSISVTLASDQAALPITDNGGSVTVDNTGTFAVQSASTLAAETTKVIGTVNISSGQTVAPIGFQTTISTDVTRQAADTTTYAINDVISDSTTAPTSGGFTFPGAARISGGSGVITDIIFTSSANPALLLAGELWIFDTAVTNINDNTAFTVSDSEIKTNVAVVPFTMIDAGSNSIYHAQNLSIGFTCVGSANLRFLLKAKNAYVPVGSEVITTRLKIIQTN